MQRRGHGPDRGDPDAPCHEHCRPAVRVQREVIARRVDVQAQSDGIEPVDRHRATAAVRLGQDRKFPGGRRQLSWPPGDNYLGRWEAGKFWCQVLRLMLLSLISSEGCRASEASLA